MTQSGGIVGRSGFKPDRLFQFCRPRFEEDRISDFPGPYRETDDGREDTGRIESAVGTPMGG
jgi:hypothetical protein